MPDGARTHKKTARLDLRVSPEDKAEFEAVAQMIGTHAGTFVVESARREARRLRSEQTLFVVDQEQWAAFDQLLDRPAMDKPRLRALLDSPSPFER